MSIFFRREFYSKAVSLLLALAFLAESTLAPILLFLPQTARAAGPTLSVSPTTFAPGAAFFVTITGLAPNGFVRVSSLNPQGVISEFTSGTANAYGSFSKSFVTSSWTSGTYKLWADANGQSNVVSFLVTPVLSLSSYNFTVGTNMTIAVSGGMPGAEVKTFCRDPNGAVCDDSVSYTTNSSGQFSHTYDTTGWTVGNYSGWVTVGGTKSNTVYFAVASVPAPETPPSIAISNADTKINPSPIILGQEVRFSTKLTVGGATAQNFQIKLDASDSLQLKSAYRDASCSTSPLPDPYQQSPTRTGTKSYVWPANYFPGGIAPGTYDFCFKFQAPASTSQGAASFYIDASSVTSTYNVIAKAVNGAAFSAPVTVPASMAIYRSPSTSQNNPYKAGDATVSSSVNSPSLFATDYAGTGYNQIGSNPVRTFPFSTRDLVNSGACNASTGTCNIPGNWSATDFVCPAGVTGVQQMTEWYTIGSTASNKLTWYFECSATNVPATRTPVGSLIGVDTSGTATGWAVDPDSPSTAISVHFYIDGAAGQGGTFAGSANANLTSSIANSSGYPGNHGFPFSIPSQWRDGQEHTLYAHGIDLSGDGSKNVLLSSVPKSFTLGTPPDSSEPTLFVSPTTFTAGSSFTISVADAAANGTVKVFCRDPNNAVCDDSVSYTTNASGQFTHTYDTTGWTAGAYRGWVTANGVQSNTVNFTVTALTTTTIPETTLSSYDFSEGASFTVYVSGVPGGSVSTFCIDPNGTQCQDTNAGTTDALGEFFKSYDTTGWTTGSYTGWATVDGVKSNIASYIVRAATTTPPVEPPSDGRPAPTPTTAPMATLTLERDQEQVLPSQPASFSGTLDSSKVAFPQGSTLFFTIPEKIAIDSILVDGTALGASDFTQAGQSVKIPLKGGWYSGVHSFKIVLRNLVSTVAQLDRLAPVWITVLDANGALLLKGRTAVVVIRHLPTEVIGQGKMPAYVIDTYGWSDYSGNRSESVIRWTGFEDISITRGPFYRNDAPVTYKTFYVGEYNPSRATAFDIHEPNGIPRYASIGNTLIPSDMTNPIPLSSFSDSLAREFITAYYQYLLGRDPTSDEVNRYMPLFVQWKDPMTNLYQVYQRRADLQARFGNWKPVINGGAVFVNKTGIDMNGLVRWAVMEGWKDPQDGTLLRAFKQQTGFEAADTWLAAGGASQWTIPLQADPKDPDSTCSKELSKTEKKFAHDAYGDGCWSYWWTRHQLILWAKDIGWATNSNLRQHFAPGAYPEYQEERLLRYPPATLYYELLSSPEYSQSLQTRFRKNIDSLYRMYFNRPAAESDIAWAKQKFTTEGMGNWHWMSEQWEPNGLTMRGGTVDNKCITPDGLNDTSAPCTYVLDYVYGIRNIQAEIDVISARLIELFEKKAIVGELQSNDAHFSRVVKGLYRLYLRRDATDAEIAAIRNKRFGDIELALNQSSEYGKDPAPDAAIKNLYRNYLGRDPNDADIAQWGDKTISTIANKIGKSQEMKELAAKHPENAYIFPVKRIKFKSCSFFCSLMKFANYIPGPTMIMQWSIFGLPWLTNQDHGEIRYWAEGTTVQQVFLDSISRLFGDSGFNGETFINGVSVGKSMVGMAGGVYNPMNLLENADATILESFRTMARAPQTSGNAFTQVGQQYPGLASPLGAITGLFSANSNQTVSTGGRIAQIDVSGHYGSGVVVPVKSSTGTAKTATVQAQFTKTLKHGSRGAEVLKLQKLLGAIDIAFSPEYQTGYYGEKTVAAVRRFQKRNGLEQVGFVGVKTRALLNSIAR